MANTIDIIVDSIRARLETIGVMSAPSSSWPNRLYFAAVGTGLAGEEPYTIYCGRRSAAIHDGQSLYGEYLYADPDFYTRLVKTVRMIVNPTSIWHISKMGSSIGMPRILDE